MDTVPGREKQLLSARERLSYMCELGKLAGRIQVYTAPRGFGKTSLLREVQRMAVGQGAVVAWVTAGEVHGVVPAIGEQLRAASSGWAGEAARGLRAAIDHATVKVNAGVASVEAGWRRDAGGQEQATHGARAFEALVREAVDGFRRHERRALVIMIDEIQSADAEGLRTLAYAWQHLQAEGTDVAAGIFAAGLPSAPAQIAEAVTFSERFGYYDLDSLPDAAVIEALATPARQLGVSWAPVALQRAVSAAEGYPYALQLIGGHAWEIAGFPDQGHVIGEDTVGEAIGLANHDLDRVAHGRWAKSTSAEKSFMSAMASLGDAPVQRADVAEAMGVATRSLSDSRGSLLSKGLIVATGHGELAFAIPRMAAYIRSLPDPHHLIRRHRDEQ